MKDRLLQTLSRLELGLATSGIYDLTRIQSDQVTSAEEFTRAIEDQLKMNSLTLDADRVVDTLVREGFLVLRDTALPHIREPLSLAS